MNEEKKELIDKIVEFIFSHYEQIDGKAPFQLVSVDPKEWWAKMQLIPSPALLPNSQKHFEARIERWKELIYKELRDE